MKEELLQYIWKHSLFDPTDLVSTSGEPITIYTTGTLNTHAGPDFQTAKIKVGNTLLVGNVEIHIQSSDWRKHGHHRDPLYQRIILHVVFEDDEPLKDTFFPTLILKDKININMLERYHSLMTNQKDITCQNQISQVPVLTLNSWLNRCLAERWEMKLSEWKEFSIIAKNDWKHLLYLRLASNFGFHVNRNAFLQLAQSIPLNILIKHHTNLRQLEALLFGQSGLLAFENQDEYTQDIEKEYHFLRRKYGLKAIDGKQWKFMRLRPANFPTIRIAQFAMLIHQSISLFSKMMEIKDAATLLKMLDIHTSEYWTNHHHFGKMSKKKSMKSLGKDAIHNILINTVAPMQFLYANIQGKENLKESSLHLLQSIPAENNYIIRKWKTINIKVNDAFESQALIQLYQNYCLKKNCLNCTVGHEILKAKHNYSEKIQS